MLALSFVQLFAAFISLFTPTHCSSNSTLVNEPIWQLESFNFSAGWDDSPNSLAGINTTIPHQINFTMMTRHVQLGDVINMCSFNWSSSEIPSTWKKCDEFLRWKEPPGKVGPIMSTSWFRVVTLSAPKSVAVEIIDQWGMFRGNDTRYENTRRRNATIYLDHSKPLPQSTLIKPTEIENPVRGTKILNATISIPDHSSDENCTTSFTIMDLDVELWDDSYASYNTTQRRYAESTRCHSSFSCKYPGGKAMVIPWPYSQSTWDTSHPNETILENDDFKISCDNANWKFDRSMAIFRSGKPQRFYSEVWHKFHASRGSRYQGGTGAVVEQSWLDWTGYDLTGFNFTRSNGSSDAYSLDLKEPPPSIDRWHPPLQMDLHVCVNMKAVGEKTGLVGPWEANCVVAEG